MNQRFEAFLAVAENQSMSRAAQQQCVSYQCISGHIRSLEEEYHVQLFNRYPHFSLTEDGMIMMEALQKIRMIEQGMTEAFADPGKDVTGHVTLGVPMSRYTEIIPSILPSFKREYPNVELEVVQDYSGNLQKQTEHGLLDMAIVVQQDQEENEKLVKVVLMEEQFLFLISHNLLSACLGEEAEAFHQKCKKKGITLREISQFPILSYPQTSRLRRIMDRYADQHDLKYQTVFVSNRSETFDAIARTDIAGCIVSQQIYPITERKNRQVRKENRLHVYRVDWGGYPFSSDIALIRNADSVMPIYKQRLMQIIGEQFKEYRKVL